MSRSASIISDARANPAVQGGDKRAIRSDKPRPRDRRAAGLRQARAVNTIWNYGNETQRKWPGYGDLAKLTAHSGSLLGLHSHRTQRLCREYDTSRRQRRKPWLRRRGQKSLGRVPFNTGHVAFDGACFVFRGARYETIHLNMPVGITRQADSFNANRSGRWSINVTVEVAVAEAANNGPAVGIDLGLGSLAALTAGEFHRNSEQALASAERAHKSRRTRRIHAKARNRRKNFVHKASKRLAKEYGLIVVGAVRPSKMAQSRFAKRVLDAGWADFKRMLSDKAMTHGGSTLEVCERQTGQSCLQDGSRTASLPRGFAGLRERMIACDDCGAVLDRGVNAARNILRIGQDALAGGAHV